MLKLRCHQPPDKVVRELNPAAWFRADTGVTVTGLGASTWADQSGNGRDLLQSTDASRPPYLSYSGTKYLYLPGVAGNYASTPDAAANSITGDIDIRVQCALTDYTPAAAQMLVAKWEAAGKFSYRFYIAAGGAPAIQTTADGSSALSNTCLTSNGVTDGGITWLRATLDINDGAGNRVATFYKSTDGSNWTQIGAAVTTAVVTTIFDGAGILEVGTDTLGTANPTNGKIYRAIIKNGIDGTTVVDFNPDLDGSDQAATITSSATGEVWTINKSASGLIANLVGSPWLMGNGTSHSMATGAFVLDQPCTIYSVGKDLTWTLNDYIADGAAKDSGALIQSATTPRFKVSAGSAIGENAGLAVGTLGVRCAVINGASSLTQVNLGTPVTGDAGAAQMDGITIFSSGAVVTGWWNGMLKEHIVFPAAHDATQRARIIQYLGGRHGIAL